MKIKGPKMTEKVLDMINNKKLMKKAVKYCQQEGGVLYVPQLQFNIDRAHIISTRNYNKIFRATYKKRRIVNPYCTLPFGYK